MQATWKDRSSHSAVLENDLGVYVRVGKVDDLSVNHGQWHATITDQHFYYPADWSFERAKVAVQAFLSILASQLAEDVRVNEMVFEDAAERTAAMAAQCYSHLSLYGYCHPLADNQFEVWLPGTDFLCPKIVTVDYFDDDANSKDGVRLDPLDPAPDKCESHTDILDVCLVALASNPNWVQKIDCLTTDGDGSDCEAIFRFDGKDGMIVKVR